MQDARALLDSLMGPSRDQAPSEHKGEDFLSDKVCKKYLVGFCPSAWFKATKREMEPCELIHSDVLREEFDKHPKADRYRREYEAQLLTFLEAAVREADMWLQRERQDCRQGGRELRVPLEEKAEMEGMKAKAATLTKRSGKLAEAGELAASQEALAEAQKLQRAHEDLVQRYTVEVPPDKVCATCGVRYTTAEDNRGNDHFAGKMHEGYTKIREKIEELKKKRSREEAPRDERGDRDRDRDRGDRERRRDQRPRGRSRSRSERRNGARRR